MTSEEFDAIESVPDRFRFHRYELIRGVLVVSPPPSNAEADPNQELGYLLRLHQEFHPQGAVVDVTLPEQELITSNRRRCDRAIWTGLGRQPIEGRDFPSIIVEFVSRSRRDHHRDYVEKRAEYLAAGVREYWIIDRFRRTMTVHRNSPAGAEPLILGDGAVYRTDLIPGFDLPLARLFAAADRWPPRSRRRRPPAGGAD